MLKRKLRRRAQAEPGYAQAVPERFGCYTPKDLGCDGKGQWVWVHAVSLGETRAAALLIKELRIALPGMRLLLTNGTATGRAEGQASCCSPAICKCGSRGIARKAVRRFVRQFQPAVGVLMETEVWPNCRHGLSPSQSAFGAGECAAEHQVPNGGAALAVFVFTGLQRFACRVGANRRGCPAPAQPGCARASRAGQSEI